jgi:NADH:ubiquinone oxidoreductase subunit C
MENSEILNSAETLLKPWATAITRPAGIRLDVALDADDLPAAVQALRRAHLGYLAAITGLDHPAASPETQGAAALGTIEVLYHFCIGPAIITLRVSVSYEAAVVPTICDLIPSATLYERELSELFGVEVKDTPDKSRLVLADEWPEGVYPLRKSFTGVSPIVSE